MGFLTDLGTVVNEQFGFGENSVTSLDTADSSGRVVNFGRLGDYADKIDKTAERTYTEDGFIRNIRPRLREIWWQQPDITVVVKKRMFSSLIENTRMDLLEDNERLFINATKRLFQNKCRLIAAYERLSKIEQVTKEAGQFNTWLTPMLLSSVSIFDSLGASSVFSSGTRETIDALHKAISYSDTSDVTSWTTSGFDAAFPGQLGEGPGTFELNMVTSVSTKVSTEFGGGSCSLTIEDPYKLMVITEVDIDQAITDSTNFFRSSPFGRFTEIETKNLIDQMKSDLAIERELRGVSQIRFVVNAQSLMSRKVRAISEADGREVIFEYKPGIAGLNFIGDLGGPEPGVEIDPVWIGDGTDQKLSPSEANLFRRIIESIHTLINFNNTTQSRIKEFKGATNYTRNKMRQHFQGKNLLQPMDVINVFMTTRTLEDLKISHSLHNSVGFGGFQIGQKFDNLVRSINATLADISGMNNRPEELEKNMIAGPGFPLWLWRMFRNDFTRQSAGTTIFVGLVQNASHSGSEGKYVLNINCEDNSGYFSKSQINLKPALDVWNSALYDPLTPFDVSFDAATGVPITDINLDGFPPLLPENRKLLNTRATRFTNRRYSGDPVDPLLYQTTDEELVPGGGLGFNTFRRVLSEPAGMVYRWKQGIQSITKTERAVSQSGITEERSPLLTRKPFAGQDVMNVLSLLITGQPYNYNTFLKAAMANANSLVASNPEEGQDAAISYIESLTNDLSKRNAVWGSFVPFKSLTINESMNAFIRRGENDLLTRNQNLSTLLRKRASLIDQLALQTAGFAADPTAYSQDANGNAIPSDPDSPLRTAENANLKTQIEEIDKEIDAERDKFQEQIETELRDNKIPLKIFGDDISYDPGLTGNSNDVTNSHREFDREEFRRQIGALTLRRLWKTKANEDPNLFIVDDQYDNNLDIQGFERKIQGALKLFDSEYTTIDQQIKSTAEILNLEIFADTQGHIQARPPKYNRMPSSVFHKMFQDKDARGIKVFPDALESLFFNQIKGVTERIEIVEDQIRLYAIAMGAVPVQTDGKLDSGLDRSIGRMLSAANETNFVFVSDPKTGNIGGNNSPFRSFILQSKPDLLEADEKKPLEAQLTNIFGKGGESKSGLKLDLTNVAGAKRIFAVPKRINAISMADFKSAHSEKTSKALDEIRSRLATKTGRPAPTLNEIFSNQRFKRLSRPTFSQIDVLNVVNKISQLVAERQKLALSAANAIKNLEEGLLVNETDDGARTVLAPALNRSSSKATIPDILQHMIEDEDLDDLGPGSGRRFVLKESRVSKINITENAPPYTIVQVNGLFGDGFADAPGGLTTSAGGNAVTSAYAVDYDTWNMYGFRATNSISAPFFSDPDAQCAPYAVFKLIQARRNILQGSVDVHGYNEFYQPGDVVYVEDRDLLFYVTDVAHSFSYGSLSTSLTLKYGHTPGEYIPTILDVVGKILYNAQGFTGQYRSARFDSKSGDQSLGSFIVDSTNMSYTDLFRGPRGEKNHKLLDNIMFSSSGLLNPVTFRRVKSTLELRYYESGEGTNTLMSDLANEIRRLLTNPEKYSNLIEQLTGQTMQGQEGFKIDSKNVKIVPVDITGDSAKTPSRTAWSVVRLMVQEQYGGTTAAQDDVAEENQSKGQRWAEGLLSAVRKNIDLDYVLMNHVIDVFITFETVEEDTKTTEDPDGERSQADIEMEGELEEANQKHIQERGIVPGGFGEDPFYPRSGSGGL
jgi:hypothetical protein